MKKEYKNQKKIFEELVGRVSEFPKIEKKRMFGYESFFTQSKCFAGVRKLGKSTSVVLKLSTKDYPEAIKESLFSPFRSTKNWVEYRATSPKDVKLLIPWIELSYSYALNKRKEGSGSS
jgi:predicted DNA-binding protein (MmcQ/YjbR family)